MFTKVDIKYWFIRSVIPSLIETEFSFNIKLYFLYCYMMIPTIRSNISYCLMYLCCFSRERHLFQCSWLSWWSFLGNASSKSLSTLSKCSSCNTCSQVFLRLFKMVTVLLHNCSFMCLILCFHNFVGISLLFCIVACI